MTLKETLTKLSTNRKLVIFFLIFFYPFGLYLMWKGEHFNPDMRWMFSFIWLLLIWLFPKQDTLENKATDCSTPIYADNCTYYRDSECNVISKMCK